MNKLFTLLVIILTSHYTWSSECSSLLSSIEMANPLEVFSDADIFRDPDFNRGGYGIWTSYHGTIRKPFDKGWKIHVSAKHNSQVAVANVVFPYLKKRGFSFKYRMLDRKDFLFKGGNWEIPSGWAHAQRAKFITVYPGTPRQALDLAKRLDQLLQSNGFTKKHFRPIAFDYETGELGAIFARWGTVNGTHGGLEEYPDSIPQNPKDDIFKNQGRINTGLNNRVLKIFEENNARISEIYNVSREFSDRKDALKSKLQERVEELNDISKRVRELKSKIRRVDEDALHLGISESETSISRAQGSLTGVTGFANRLVRKDESIDQHINQLSNKISDAKKVLEQLKEDRGDLQDMNKAYTSLERKTQQTKLDIERLQKEKDETLTDEVLRELRIRSKGV